VGDVGIDLAIEVPHHPADDEKVLATGSVRSCGGVVANAAVACQRQGQGARLFSQVGDDPAGQQIRQELTRHRVDASALKVVCGPTTQAVSMVDATGEKRLVLVPGSTMYPDISDVVATDLSDVGWVHSAVYDAAAASALARRCAELGLPLSLDLEPATLANGCAPLAEVLAETHVAFVNERAAALLGADAVGLLRDKGVRTVILTQGPRGATAVGHTGALRVPAIPGLVIDTTGAGDCLAGTFVSWSLRGASLQEALTAAVTAASLACRSAGAQPSFPDLAATQAALPAPIARANHRS
jgi:ribokinase